MPPPCVGSLGCAYLPYAPAVRVTQSAAATCSQSGPFDVSFSKILGHSGIFPDDPSFSTPRRYSMAATARAAANSNIEDRLTTLRSDLETLQKDIRGLAGEVGGVASNRANEALRSAEKLAQRAYELAE